MLNQVTVTAHPESGLKIVPGKTKGYGTIRVDSEEAINFSGNFANMRKRTAFIKGDIQTLKRLLEVYGDTWEGKIIRHTSVEPFYEGQQPVMNPNTGEVVLREGQEFYQEFIFTQDLSATDREIEPKPEMA